MNAKETTALILCISVLSGCERQAPSGRQAVTDTATAADTAGAANSYRGPKACELVSADDVRQVTGASYNAGITTTDYMYDSQCKLTPADTTKPAVVVTLHAQGNMEPYRRMPGITKVAGMGDEAIWIPQANQLAVRVGQKIFSVSILTEPLHRDWATGLARVALTKLQP